jgi:hypothetical protein
MTTIILTLAQARDLQQQITAWPSGWHFLLHIERPEKPDTQADPERMTAGLKMLQLGCRDEQIAEQLGWKIPCGALNTLHRIAKQHRHK